MGLNEPSVRIDRKQPGKSEHVCRRFQNPAALASPKLQMLQEMAVPGVSGREVLLQKPAPIRRYIVHGIELVAQETQAHQADTFLWQFRAHRVDLRKSGRKPAQTGETPRRFANAAFRIFVADWR